MTNPTPNKLLVQIMWVGENIEFYFVASLSLWLHLNDGAYMVVVVVVVDDDYDVVDEEDSSNHRHPSSSGRAEVVSD